MSFKRRTGKTKVMWLPVTTSTAIAKDSLVAWSSGLLIAATSTTAAQAIAGVSLKACASTDSDYATARTIPVEVPVENFVEWEATTASLVTTDLGYFADLTDASTVNRGASTYDIFQITKYVSATVAWGVLNIGPAGMGTT